MGLNIPKQSLTIEANNYKAVGTIETSFGDILFSVPMQSFEFKKSLM